MTRASDRARLIALAGSQRPRADASLQDQVRWLEELTAVAARALDDDAAQGALTDLRAALGAVVAWGRGPRTEESLRELELTFRALVTRGSVGLCEALARDLAALGAHDARAKTAAGAFTAAAHALAHGEPLAPAHVDAMRALEGELRTQTP